MMLAIYLWPAAETYRQQVRSFDATDKHKRGETTMRNIAKTAIALTIAATAVVAAASSSYAQSKSRYQYQQNQNSNSVPYDVPRDRGASNG
jgi:hypothetical protein